MAKPPKTKLSGRPITYPKSSSFRIITSHTLKHSYRVYGDNQEILAAYFHPQIGELKKELNALTIYEDAFEIRAICKKIIVIRSRLEQLKQHFPASQNG